MITFIITFILIKCSFKNFEFFKDKYDDITRWSSEII